MKIQLASDLHLEARFRTSNSQIEPHKVLEDRGADVVILAGDIMPSTGGIEFANLVQQRFQKPVIYVFGNHEFYGVDYQLERQKLKALAEPGVFVLDRDEVVIDGVRFLGCTLWTDFALFGTPEHSMQEAEQALADFVYIRMGQRLMTASDQLVQHQTDVAWLEEKLQLPHAKTVVVTHHAPSRQSVADEYADDSCTPAFVSDLARLMGPGVSLWCHGHTHNAFNYVENGTQVVCNPLGYPGERGYAWDKSSYRDIVIDLD